MLVLAIVPTKQKLGKIMKKYLLSTALASSLLIVPSAYAAEDELNKQIESQGTGETYISGYGFRNKKVIYEKKNGLAILEGDIVLGTIEEAESWRSKIESSNGEMRPQSIIRTGERYRWKNNTVPYDFGPNVSDRVIDMVHDALDHWEENTHIRFVFRDASNADQYPNYVRVIDDERACWSQVGMRGGMQRLNVHRVCGFGSTVHEFGHVLGLWHEQSREDRDQFVTINWDNIEEEFSHNFDQHIHDGDDIGPYDYDSIMHYGRFAFSINGQPTITPLQPVIIGQRRGLSDLDIAAINQLYPLEIPEAVLDKDSYSVFLGNSILFDASKSFDPNGSVLSYSWDMGDGKKYTPIQGIFGHIFLRFDFENTPLPTVEHTYANRGKYTVKLTVADPDGNTATDEALVTVYGTEVLIPVITSVLL